MKINLATVLVWTSLAALSVYMWICSALQTAGWLS